MGRWVEVGTGVTAAKWRLTAGARGRTDDECDGYDGWARVEPSSEKQSNLETQLFRLGLILLTLD